MHDQLQRGTAGGLSRAQAEAIHQSQAVDLRKCAGLDVLCVNRAAIMLHKQHSGLEFAPPQFALHRPARSCCKLVEQSLCPANYGIFGDVRLCVRR